jgi:glycosyltransferase involved in cell wall biosynthesis
MNREKYDIVHTHLFESSLAGLVAARIARVRNRIVTRHHSDYHHAYFPSSVKYDRLINSLATRIVAVSSNVRNILISAEHADPAKIITIPHGIDAGEFHPDSVSDERISLIRNKYHLPPAAPVIGVVSRFIAWKGIQFIIPAFMDLKKKYPNALLILANAQGPYIEQVSEMLRVLPAGDYRLIPFEADIPALLNAFTCFVHVPVSETAEAFGQVYIEALAAGVPSVITRSGVALDYAVDGHNCLLVPYRDSAAISLALQRILSSPDLAARLRLHGYEVVGNHYHIRDKYTALSQLYDEMN